ncbi:SDR family NAD(P)-dependent oxidoreductase [Streptomyces sp. TBY4]|uniref:SDR family NAD(P)-dependent oxidoreductase n=1 Tax=Streptomyces sp. TBY4 TaxID=2962030 RepID=UPI0020B89110|nr:SDR family NAD(P)-dependent oxidoreductase [Streptomyces sp. TBY4]MCP3760512.1 SDR family NAD(P)-dependent oxidoreductase [Streptomyces sp. TBY4]
MTENTYESAVALVGMSGRFPGAADVAGLWRNLLQGVSGLRAVTDEELAKAGVAPGMLADPRYVRVDGAVDGLDLFDASVFGLNPREAETMEPQHRLFLECAWEALEGAGYSPMAPAAQVGVFAGCGFPDYMLNNVAHLATEPGGGLLLAVGNERDSLASLVSYKLGLRGPSMTVQTFCSTSLVSVHLAAQSLLTYECDLALAGGAFLPLPQPSGYLYEQGGIMSPDGRVRSFDASANGTVMGAGVGAVALKRMSDAIEDGDVIHAVILGSAVNNDGRERVGYTAPGVDGQASVIETALAVAGVEPGSIGYVECHATGTQLGDSIELAAMNRVFDTQQDSPCVLGSLKPSLGHLDRASGVAGLMRAALCLREGVLPAMPGFETPNPALAAAGKRFAVLTEDQPWPEGPTPRRAGVSSFGLGGTNAHVVLEEAPVRPARPATPGPHLLTFSAATPEALDALTDRLALHLAEHRTEDLADVAFTLQVSRGHFALRRAVVCVGYEDAVAALRDPGRWIDAETSRRAPGVRLTTGDGVPETWWDELSRAVAALLPRSEGHPDVPAGRDGALAALAAGLERIGVSVLGAADPAGAEAVEIVMAPGADAAADWLPTVLARVWQAGAAVDWAALHGGRGRRVELPTYPFQRRRYWVKGEASRPVEREPEGRVDDPGRWTYVPGWRRHPVPVEDLDGQLRAAGPWLVLAADARAEALVDRLVLAGAEVVAVRPGEAYGQDDNGDFTVRPAESDDLAEVLAAQFVAPRTVVHGFALASAEGSGAAHFDAELERGFRSALALARAFAEDPHAASTELTLLTSGAAGVVGADLTHPEHAALAALAPSLAQENPLLACRHVDVDAGVDGEDAEQVLAAVLAPHEGPVAVRGAELWLRHYEPCPLPVPGPEAPLFRPRDTVLITGGLGDVGLLLARRLASAYGCRLVLTARTELPPREEWPAYLDGAAEDDRTARHIRSVLDLEERGAEVLALSADVADEERMREVVRAAVESFGGIDAVVHGAGVQNPDFFDLAHLSDPAMCDAHFRAKVHGFHVLQSVLGEQAAGRRVTLSSLATVLGGIALGPYAAANAALDAYARAARLGGAGRWTTVDWDTWAVSEERVEGHGPAVRAYEMTPTEGVDVFERVLGQAGRTAHVVVSTGPVEPRLRQWVTGGPAASGEAEETGERHPRPALATPYEEPEAGLEETVAGIWADTLGLERVGALDNFFELGGHSLIAIQLVTRMRTALSASVPVTALVDSPTVREIAVLVARSRA